VDLRGKKRIEKEEGKLQTFLVRTELQPYMRKKACRRSLGGGEEKSDSPFYWRKKREGAAPSRQAFARKSPFPKEGGRQFDSSKRGEKGASEMETMGSEVHFE